MSLKAKIEAVIYAAEEPVTLAQLVSLLSHEAASELDRIASAQQSLELLDSSADPGFPPPPSEPEVLNSEVLLVEDELPAAEAEQGSTPPPTGEPQTPSAPGQLARDEKDRARDVRNLLRDLLDQLIRDYTTPDRGLEIREVAGGFRLATKPEFHDAVRGFVKSLKPPLKLTLQSLETLAVVAYKQPVTAPEISEIRGVDSGGPLGSLMARKLVTTAGRKQVIGRPILYKTTRDFLLRFGLKDINELPGIEEFEKMAGELADTDPILANLADPEKEFQQQSQQQSQRQSQEQSPMNAETPHTDPELTRLGSSNQADVTRENMEEEKDATEPQADGDGATVETVSTDGRLSGITPPQDPAGDTNTSAAEAEIQNTEA